MAAYFVASYDISDADGYAKYNPGSMGLIMETLMRHGGEVLAAGHDAQFLSGQRDVTVVLKFPSAEAANAWHDDPDYAQAKALRLSSTDNIVAFVAPEFVMPQ